MEAKKAGKTLSLRLSDYIYQRMNSTLIEPVEYAGFGLRMKALVIDFIIAGIIGNCLRFISKNMMDSFSFVGIEFLIPFIIFLLMALFTSSRYQGTFGKIMLKIKVADAQGHPISFIRALARYGVYFAAFLIPLGITFIALSISGFLPASNQLTFLKGASWMMVNAIQIVMVLPFIGLVMILFTRRKQALHDKLLHTLVLRYK